MTKNGEFLTAIKSKALEIVAEGNEHDKKLKSLQSMADEKIYALDYLAELRDDEMAKYRAKDYSLRETLKERIDDLFNELNEARANINDASFQNAFNMINVLGEQMDRKTLENIVANFRGRMSELHLLKKACVSANVGNCVALFDDYLVNDDYRETWKKQTDNLLIFSHSFGIISKILGENLEIEPETVSADAGRAFNNRMVL